MEKKEKHKAVIELTCEKTGNKIHVVTANVCHWFKNCEGEGSCVHMVCGECLCVKECPETIHCLLK